MPGMAGRPDSMPMGISPDRAALAAALSSAQKHKSLGGEDIGTSKGSGDFQHVIYYDNSTALVVR
jgi:hypothetical protein